MGFVMFEIIDDCLYRLNLREIKKAGYHEEKLGQADSFAPRAYHGLLYKIHNAAHYALVPRRNRRLLKTLEEFRSTTTEEDRKFWEEFDRLREENPFRL